MTEYQEKKLRIIYPDILEIIRLSDNTFQVKFKEAM